MKIDKIVVAVASAGAALGRRRMPTRPERQVGRKCRASRSEAHPPPGLYMVDQVFTYQTNLRGPGNNVLNPHGTTTGVPSAVGAAAFVWIPGWTFLGATYNASWATPVGMFAAGNPVNTEASGMINTFIAPVELSWKLGDSGFFVKSGLGMYVPDGTVTGISAMRGGPSCPSSSGSA